MQRELIGLQMGIWKSLLKLKSLLLERKFLLWFFVNLSVFRLFYSKCSNLFFSERQYLEFILIRLLAGDFSPPPEKIKQPILRRRRSAQDAEDGWRHRFEDARRLERVRVRHVELRERRPWLWPGRHSGRAVQGLGGTQNGAGTASQTGSRLNTFENWPFVIIGFLEKKFSWTLYVPLK